MNFKSITVGILGTYPPPYGGVSVSIKQCSEIWASRGHKIHVMNLAASGGTRIVKKVFVHDIAVNKTLRRTMLPAISSLTYRHIKRVNSFLKQDYPFSECIGYLSLISKVENICKRYEIEILHSHHLSDLRSVIAWACSKDVGIPFVVSGYGEAWRYRGDERMLGRMKRVANSTARVIATSEHCKRGIVEFLKFPYDKVSVIYAGVDIQRYNPDVDALWLKKKYTLSDENIMLFVGHLIPRKGPELVIRALPWVLKKVKKTKLLFVGPDYVGYRSELESVASQLSVSNNVIFAGEIDEKDLPAHYSLADVLVFPSTTPIECMGMSLKQAMAASLPVVGAKMGGIPEAILDGETGYFVKPGDEKELAEKVVILLKDKKLRSRMGLKGRKRALKLFGKEAMAEKLLNLYEIVLGYK